MHAQRHHAHPHHPAHYHDPAHHPGAPPVWSAVSHAVSGWAHHLGGAINRAVLASGRPSKRRGGKGPWSGPPGVPWGFPPMY